jgi:hypothetical protein
VTALSKHFSFGPVHGVAQVSRHALERLRERSGTKAVDEIALIHQLETWMRKAVRCYLKPERRLSKLISHKGVLPDYWAHGKLEWIIVVRGGVIVTVHRNQSDEWQYKKGTHDT